MHLAPSIALICCLIASAPASDYYVSTSGNDGNAGTSMASPWQTIAKVNTSNFVAGDRVFFAGGQTFTNPGLMLDASDTGSAANPIVIGSYGTGRAIIRATGNVDGLFIYNTGGVRIQDLIVEGPGVSSSTKSGIIAYCDLANGSKLTGLAIANCEARQFRNGIIIGAWHASFSGFSGALVENCVAHDNSRSGISSYGYTTTSAAVQSHASLTIRGCETYLNRGDPLHTANHSGSGIVVSGTVGGLVDQCYAHHNGGSAGNPGGGGPVGIWTYQSDGVVIQRCLVHDQKTTAGVKDGGGFDIDGGAVNAVIQYCYSYNNEGPGYLICEYSGADVPVSAATIRYCLGWNDARRRANDQGAGFDFYNGYDGDPSKLTGVTIHNNLVYADAAVAGACVKWEGGPLANVRFANNIFVVTGGSRFVDIAAHTADFSFVDNAYFSSDANYSGGWKWSSLTYTSLDAWRSASGAPETWSGSPVGMQADPLLANVVGGAQPTSIAALESITAYRLLAGSPCIDAGQDLRTAAFGSRTVGSRDFFNQTIPQGGAFDIGAHETTPATANTAPTISPIDGQAILEDAPTGAIAVTIGDAETAAGSLTLAAASSNPTLVPIANVVFAGSFANRTATVTPAADRNGLATITVTVTDGGGLTASRSFTVNVTAVNDEPSFVPGADQNTYAGAGAQTVASWATAISAGPTDESGQTLTFQVSANSNPGLFATAPAVSPAGTLSYTPASNANGTATISLMLVDNGGTANGGVQASAMQTFMIACSPTPLPNLVVSRSSVIIGSGGTDRCSAALGANTTIAYVLANSGQAVLSIATATVVAHTGCIASVSALPAASVVAGTTTGMGVDVTPQAANWSFTISVTSNDPDTPSYAWTIRSSTSTVSTAAKPCGIGSGIALVLSALALTFFRRH
ncbi:MAG: right-handed parallel beta-helix repeat-containing protein [Planctomycetes bacterium]|nr:right-handed parallel beta-helix repeat-containing protein [Planctomycetota bacterium]